ncbi:F-box protein CPR1-like, partial [Lycium ferocissimum]|uniref:F-box protein CPR1-like n=1 Tax=Lycium ferocissimum TaxID=112874 RepID=UPI002815AD94
KHCFYSLHFDSLNSRVVTPKELTNPLSSSESDTKILGSCNGLLLISNTVNDLALWNPSTGKYKKLPVLSVVVRENGYVTFGFGYDVANDDYKVVRIMQFLGTEKGSFFSSDVKVYSLKSNSWNGVEEFPYLLRYKEEPGKYLNGALHWIVNIEMKIPLQRLIVSFDLETEKCRIVPHPPYSDENFSVKLEVLGGCLCTYHSYWGDFFIDDWEHMDRCLDYMDVWVMKEYGVKE